jgi:predicted small lipoprotein YifL
MKAMQYVVLALSLAACGDDGGSSAPPDADPSVPDAAPREIITETVPLAINELREAIMVGGKGDVARITLMAPSPAIDWNIHSHPNGTTIVVTEAFKQTSVDYTFVPTQQAEWYLLVRNKGLTDINMQLKIELYGNITWSGWQ